MLEIQKDETEVARFKAVSLEDLEEMAEGMGMVGFVHALLRGPSGEIKQEQMVRNLITQVGDQYYGERAAGIATPPVQVTGMRLGTNGPTAVAASKTGAGAAIVGYIAGSQAAITSGYPTSALSGSSRRIQWKSTWAAGVATNSAIAEAVITNESPLTDVAGTAANTIARAVLSAVNKAAGDTLEILWSHDLLGA